uniref:Alternative protein PLCE1 n=1 Tax=Homo sapiens TaxID=9606 RepID=L8EAV1_HUMAN|nr:alternative protein PLCE1 [Homo sapiens]
MVGMPTPDLPIMRKRKMRRTNMIMTMNPFLMTTFWKTDLKINHVMTSFSLNIMKKSQRG